MDARRAAELAARNSFGRLVAYLAAQTRDVAAAEDAIGDAFLAALHTWPDQGVPTKPEAWLLVTARRKLIDMARRSQTQERVLNTLKTSDLGSSPPPDGESAPFPDDRLKLLFICAHPAIDGAMHTPLMLQTILGLNAHQIASAFLVSPTAMGQRLVRAKAKIRDAGIAFEIPEAKDLPARLQAVLEAIYAVYTLGWDNVAGSDSRHQGLTEEAIWLARLCIDLMPEEPEAKGLLALMLFCEARAQARRTAEGAYVPLSEQNTELWSQGSLHEAEQILGQAAAAQRLGRFQLEAAIQSAHMQRSRGQAPDWDAIVLLYEGLLQIAPTLGARVSQAAAIAEAQGFTASLNALESIPPDAVKNYQPYWALKAHLLQNLSQAAAAKAAYQRAIGLSEDAAIREFLLGRSHHLPKLSPYPPPTPDPSPPYPPSPATKDNLGIKSVGNFPANRMTAYSTAPFSPAEIASEGIKPEEYDDIVQRLGRHPNRAELGMFGVMWSEHCCYKNSRPLLKQFPTEGPRVLVGPGENAGVIDAGDGLRVAFKIESHNHPSAVEPFQGAATGVGGILRDIFTMGARPIAVLNSLRFGDLADSRTRRLCQGVVSGIAHYGNCFGVPTVGGEVYFDAAYNGNPLVNAMAIGIMETDDIVKSGAAGIGNPVVYVGSTTGRDGMGGASFASAELTDESEANRPAVQVGDPFLEKSLVEACLEAFKTGAIVAAQDMGAAGLTCSTAEMAAKGGVGIELDLDLIPVRETGMVPYEYLLSESQERMLFVVAKGREPEVIEIFERWGLHAVVAGTVIQDSIVRILFKGEVAAEIPALALAENTPIYHRELLSVAPEYAQAAWAWSEDSLPPCSAAGIVLPELGETTWTGVLHQLLGQPTIASKNWVYRQYDHQVQNNTVQRPGQGDAAVIRLRPLEDVPGYQPGAVTRGLAATVDCNARYVYLNPYEGAKAAVAEAARNLSCVGAVPLAVTDNLNFGSPEKPIGYWQLANACRGLADACREFETPVTGGNVSLYNETVDSQGNTQPIYPTPVVGMVGLIDDLSRTCGQGWQQDGDFIYLMGVTVDQTVATEIDGLPLVTLGGSEYLAGVHGRATGHPPAIDMALEKRVQAACRHGIAQGWVQSAHDCAEGGLAVALAESCITSQRGAAVQLSLEASQTSQRWDRLLFGEGGARIVVSVSPRHQADWEAYLGHHLADAWQWLGTVQGDTLTLVTRDGQILIAEAVEPLAYTWHTAIEQRLARES